MSNWELPPKGGHQDLPDGIYLQTMTWKQIQERLQKDDLLIVPIGSTENHGPHACIGEDTFLVNRMAELVAQKTGCTVAQPLCYGSHPYHHLGMPGTVVVPEEIFNGMLKSMMAGFWNMGFRKMILLNGHGQEYVIPTAIHQFMKTYQLPAVIVNLNWYHAVPDHFKTKAQGGVYETNFIHADEVETSWSLALFPEMIRMQDAVDTKPKRVPAGRARGQSRQSAASADRLVRAGRLRAARIGRHAGGRRGQGYRGQGGESDSRRGQLLDYMVKLHDDIMATFPAGKLPPIEAGHAAAARRSRSGHQRAFGQRRAEHLFPALSAGVRRVPQRPTPSRLVREGWRAAVGPDPLIRSPTAAAQLEGQEPFSAVILV